MRIGGPVTAGREYLLRLWDAAAAAAGERKSWLYLHGYTQRFPDSSPLASGPSIIEELARANTSQAGWDASWQVEEAAADGRVLGHRPGARRWFEPGEYLSLSGPGHRPGAGDPIRVHVARESQTLQDAFYYAFGETVNRHGPRNGGLRIYWNVQQAGAAPLMAALTRHFNRFQIPFRFKCVHRAGHFARLDAAVLYLDRSYWAFAAPVLRHIVDDVGEGLAAGTPLFARPLAPGLALAEDPPGGSSFGQHRCALLAEAIERCPAGSAEDRWSALEERFQARGLRLDRPYLNAGSEDTYDFS